MNERLQELGARLKDEEERLLDYREIEERSTALGFPTSERTLRFYVSEGVLPPPQARRGGRTPVYREDWILPVLLAIHAMKTRFGRSLAEIREVLRNLREEPALLAEKLRALYEDVLQPAGCELSGAGAPEPPARLAPGLVPVALTSEQAHEVVEAFFARLTGKRALQPSEVSVLDLVAEVVGGGRAGDPPPVPALPLPEALPDGAVLLERARALEELFIARFDEKMAEVRRLPHPLDGTMLNAGPRDRTHQRRARSDEVVDLMKRHRIYERALLDAMPRDEASVYRVFTRSIFGRRETRLVLAACVVSPLQELLVRRCASRPAGVPELERALELIGLAGAGGVEEPFCYVGVLSTTGWEPEVAHHLAGRDRLVCAVQWRGGTRWQLQHAEDERWGGVLRLFDPESDREKVERVRRHLESHPELSLRGGHVVVRAIQEEMEVEERLLARAVGELLARDPELSLLEVGERAILKRRRL
ncbi:MAG: hypothetical protein KatS3mg102_0236 [Planctomycetota bacterium]|nr:MAG: hypothetical protein KatS3mg102_0236 [Planctomycetota bacterium]